MNFVDGASDILSDIAANGFAAGMGNFLSGDIEVHTNYRNDWQALYQKHRMVERDPVVLIGIRHSGVTDWPQPADTDNEVIRRAADFGIRNGITVANSIGGNRLIVGLSADRPLSKSARDAAFETIQETHISQLIIRAEALSEAQKDLVALFANGFRAKQVAEFFEVSEEAIKQRKGVIQNKIGVTSFLTVVNICAMAGLTRPRRMH